MWRIEISRSFSSVRLIFYSGFEDATTLGELNVKGSIEIDEGEIEKWKRAIDFLNKQS